MEDLLAKAGSQAVTFAIRSGLSIASGYAIKTLGRFMEKLPESQKSSLALTKTRLQTKIMVITPAIDLIELISARGNTSLESTVELTQDLKQDIDEFEKKVDEINEHIIKLNANGGTESSTKETAEAAKNVEEYMKSLLFRIEESIPLISLALTTSGANLSSRLPDSVSPGRLLQAANYVSTADNAFVSASKKKKNPMIQVGPTFTLKLYTIFYGTARNPHTTAAGDITWKEEHAKCQVSVYRVPDKTRTYKYQLTIDEDLDDGRYHDEEEEKDGGRTRTVDVTTVTRLFFSASGRLLEIEDAKTPVLVLKLNSVFEGIGGGEYNDINGHIEWLAFEQHEDQFMEENNDGSEDEEDAEEQEDEASSSQGSDEETKKSTKEETKDECDVLADKMANLSINKESNLPTLSLLEYILRLTALQANDQASMYEIHDERIALYLRDEGATSANVDSDGTPRASPQQANFGSPSTLHVSQPYNRKLNRSSTSPRTPRSKAASQRNSPVPLTPWEQDRLHNNPSLRRALDMEYVESPLKGKKPPK